MRWGVLNLYCPICGKPSVYDGNHPGDFRHHKKFGILCSPACHEAAEMKYARMILGKDDPPRAEPADRSDHATKT